MDFKLRAKEKVDSYNATDSLIILFRFGINQWRTFKPMLQNGMLYKCATQLCRHEKPKLA